jgi:hypothetical protein
MEANEDQPGHRMTHGRARRGALRLALAVGACGLGLYVAPGHAAEPLDCNPIYPQINIHDARSVAPGTFCALYTADIHSSGSLTNAGTVFNFQRVVNHDGGILVNAATGVFRNAVKTQLINNGNVQNFGTLSNDGAVWGPAEIFNGGALSNYGTLTNGSHGVLTSNGSVLNRGGVIDNLGHMSSSGMLMNDLSGVLANWGTLSSNGTLDNLSGGHLINHGTLESIGSLRNMNAAVENFGDLINGSTLTNLMGTITNVGDLQNLGTLRNQFGGTLTNLGSLSNAGTLTNELGGTLTNYGSLSNFNTLKNEAGGTLTNYSSLSNKGRLRNEVGATLINHAALKIQAGTLANEGTFTNTLNGTLTNKGRFDNGKSGHFDNAGTFRNDGEFVNAGTVKSKGGIRGSGVFTQTAGTTTFQGDLSQGLIRIDGGTLAGSGHVTSASLLHLGDGAVLSPGEDPGDIGSFIIDAQAVELYGSMHVDVDSLTSFDTLVSSSRVTFDPFAIWLGSTWFDFYLGNNTSQRDGDTFDFFSASAFSHLDDVNFRCYGLMQGFGCELNEIDGGRGLQLALSGPSGGAGDGGGSVGVPEPGAFGLMCLGLALIGGGLGWRGWRDAVPMRIRRAADPKMVARARRRRSRHG